MDRDDGVAAMTGHAKGGAGDRQGVVMAMAGWFSEICRAVTADAVGIRSDGDYPWPIDRIL